MATTTLAAVRFWLMAVITVVVVIIIVIAFHQFSPPSVSTSAGGSDDESDDPRVNTLLWCLRRKNIMPFPRGPFSSEEEESRAWYCRDIFRAMGYSYDFTGILPSDYLEALRLLHGKDQAAMDDHIRRLSLQQQRRNETLSRLRLYDSN